MSRLKRVPGGDPPRGTQPRLAPQTRRQVINELANGSGYVLVAILALPVLVIGVVAYFLGVDALAGFLAKALMRALEAPIVRVIFGVSIIWLAGWGTLRVYRRRRLPEVTVLAIVLWGVTSLIMVSLGVIALATVVTNESGAARF